MKGFLLFVGLPLFPATLWAQSSIPLDGPEVNFEAALGVPLSLFAEDKFTPLAWKL
jgi:hypothetical protein